MAHFMRGSPGQITKHFAKAEHACKCGNCDEQLLDIKLYQRLELLRTRIGNRPIKINSGYRCPTHNEAVGGTKGSQHCLGRAADIAIPEKYAPIEFGAIADLCGFTGIGIYKSWVHVDVRPTMVVKRWGMWS